LFTREALRLDMRQRVIAGAETFSLERLRLEREWPARVDRFTASPDWGEYRLSLHDPADGALLFRQGFDTGLAADARAATTAFSIRAPMPRRALRATFEKRRGANLFAPVSAIEVDPASPGIARTPNTVPTRVDIVHASGGPAAKVDIVILGDGYQEAQYTKFTHDARRATEYLFSVEPFKTRMNDFNVRSVFTASADSGVTDVYLGLHKNTAFRCTYFSGGSERALADGDHHAVREAASTVPYDFLLLLANARRYGGSAYFGGPAVAAIDSAAARYLVIHEFAHVIGGLADEYYLPDAGGPVYGGNIEPWHPNVTISPGSGKWRAHPPEAGPRPSSWNKAEYDKHFASYVKRYEALRANGAPEQEVEQFMALERQRLAAVLAKNSPSRAAGYHEGANGYARGMYRAEVDCIMFSPQTRYFCVACHTAIERMIDAHCQP
jgi:hypothetical protein